MPKTASVRIDRIEIIDLEHQDEYRYVQIASDGDIFLSDSAGDDRVELLIRKHMIPALVKAMRLAGRL